MAAEADQAKHAEREQAQRGRGRGAPALTPGGGREQQERQHQAGGHLDADAGHECGSAGAQARACPGSQGEGAGEREQDQGVVVRASDSEHEQHRVQADERDGRASRVPEPPGGAPDQRDRREAAGCGQRLERPQATGQAERSGAVARECEQGSVGGVLERPADERKDFVAGGLGRHVRIGVEAVQGAHAREAEVAEHVLGEQRGAEQQDHVRGQDRGGDRGHRQRAREHEHEQVARADDEHERLEAARVEGDVQACKRA